MTKKHPTQQKLKSKWWYRILEVLFWIILLLTGFAPFYQNSSEPLLDATIGIAINAIVMLILKKVLIYITYGPKEKNQKPSEPISYKPLIYILILAVAISLIFTIKN